MPPQQHSPPETIISLKANCGCRAGALPLTTVVSHQRLPSALLPSIADRVSLRNTHILLLLVIAVRTLASGLLSSPNHFPRRAVRQGAAWPTERPSRRLVVLWVVSRRQVPHRRRTLVVAGRRRRRPQVHGSAAQCPVPPCRGGPVRVLGRVHASTRPVSGVRVTVRCPRVSTHPLSNVRVWTSRCPGVGCPRVRVRVRGVCTGDFMERVGAAGSHTARRARVWPSRRIRERHAIGLSQGGFCSGLSGVAADARSGCRR